MTVERVLLLAAALFSIGLFGVLARRQAIAVLLSIELMFNAVHLAIVGLTWARPLAAGIVLVLFGIAVTVAEISVGLAIVLLASRRKKTTVLDELSDLSG